MSALSGHYHFDLKSLFSQGWELCKSNMPSILLAAAVTLALAVFLTVSVLAWFDIRNPADIAEEIRLVLDIILIFLTAPLVTGIMMMGLHASVGQRVKATDVFNFLPISLWLAIGSLMISVLVQAGLFLFILPGLYAAIASSFTLMIIAEKGYRPSQALLLSIKMVNRYWLDFIKLYAVFMLLFVASVLVMGIGLIWTVPLYYNVKGIIYRDLFGVNTELSSSQQGDKPDESLFKA